MTRWMLLVDGVPTMYYEKEWDAHQDAQYLRYTMGVDCPTIEIKRMTQSWK